MSPSIPTTMRALQISEQAGLDAIKEVEAPVPSLDADGQILIRICYAGVNL